MDAQKRKVNKEKQEKEQLEKERLEKIEIEFKKDDEDKINDFISDLESLSKKYTFKSDINVQMYNSAKNSIIQIIDSIKERKD